MSNQYTYKPLEKEEIIKIYINSDRNMTDAAIVLGSTRKILWKSLQYHGIQAKSPGAPGKPRPYAGKGQLTPERIKHLEWKENRRKLKKEYGFIPRFTKEEINKLYNESEFTTRKAAKKLSCSYRYIEKLLKAYGLPIPVCKKNITILTPTLDDYKKWLNGSRRMNISNSPYFHVYVPEHPRVSNNRSMPEHRLIAEIKIGRLLEENEVVHHLNGNKKDNRPENLEVLTREEHSRFHLDAVKEIPILNEEISRLKKLLTDSNIEF